LPLCPFLVHLLAKCGWYTCLLSAINQCFIFLPRFAKCVRCTCLLNAINQCFFAAAIVHKIVWAARAERPFSFTQRHCWKNCYESEVLCSGDCSPTGLALTLTI
jgi:hypothetical protein